MLKLVEAMRQKNIPFFFLVGDMPTYKLVTQLKEENPHQFKDIVPILGTFHQQMSYIYAIYKRFKGSGMADTQVTAGIVAEGSVDQALQGRHYRRGQQCILLWREALIHLHLQKILEHQELPENVKLKLDTLRNALTETQGALDDAHSNVAEENNMLVLVNRVYKEAGTDMGDFWLSFLEMTDPLVQNVDACHARHLTEYISSTYDMLPGLMTYDNHEYGRWLPDYWAMLSSLSEEQMAFFSDHFTQSITEQPYTCQSLDLWIETTMNLNSKLKQGWLQLLQNEKQLFSTTRNTNNVARVKAGLRRNLNCQNLHRKHVECQPARMKKDEQAVQDLLTCIVEFDADPFDPSNPTLRLKLKLFCTNEYSPKHGLSQQPFTRIRDVILQVSRFMFPLVHLWMWPWSRDLEWWPWLTLQKVQVWSNLSQLLRAEWLRNAYQCLTSMVQCAKLAKVSCCSSSAWNLSLKSHMATSALWTWGWSGD